MKSIEKQARSAASTLAESLAANKKKIVFAESCTAGMVAALLGGVPGISNYLCGSTVTYRQSAKTDWLGVCPELLAEFSAESKETTAAMAIAVLAKTTEADLAIAVTGHLGPGADDAMDGRIFIAVAQRASQTTCRCFGLTSDTRTDRQLEASGLVLELAMAELDTKK
jgi:PncC family amidohydrolase